MGDAAMGGTDGWRRACLGGLLLAVLGGCGGGDGELFVLPEGTDFDTVAADRVLVVIESQNACGDTGGCTPAPPGACHLGEGNTRGLAVYRLGAAGLLFDDPTDGEVGAVAEQVIATDDNPRRVIAHPNDPTLLYVATNERIQVFRLASAGGTRCIDETASEAEIRPDADDLDAIDLLIDPTIGNGILYVAAKGANRIDAYTIENDGTLPPVPTSCVVGTTVAEFTALAMLSDRFIASGGRDRVEVYERIGGQFADVQNPTPTPTPTGPPAVTPTGEGSPATTSSPSGTPSPAPTCIGAVVITQPISSLAAGLVTDVEFLPSATTPLGDLVITEETSRRLFAFPVDVDGQISGDDDGQTTRAGLYQRMLRVAGARGDILYASVFQEGRIDAFQLENGHLPDANFSKTREDPFTLPVGLAVDGPDGPVLYVAQEGAGRVDGFRIRTDGGLPGVPTTSTALVRDPTGRTLQTFPDDVVIVPRP